MGAKTKISWTAATWNPIRARLKEPIERPDPDDSLLKVLAKPWGYHCEHISPGCINCYAESMNGRMLPSWGTGLKYNVPNRDKVEIFLDEVELDKPRSWRIPRKIFPCSMTDMFADFVTDEMLDQVFSEMVGNRKHTYQVLTKRADRMMRYMLRFKPDGRGWVTPGGEEAELTHCPIAADNWPPKNIHLGVSAEDQQRADERIPLLLQTPAAVRWVSIEPQLEAIDIVPYLKPPYPYLGSMGAASVMEMRLQGAWESKWNNKNGLDWVVIGGESGRNARPFRVEWAESLIAQCRAAGVPPFLKQLGSDPIWAGASCAPIEPSRGKNDDPEQWPESLRVQEWPK